MTLFYQDDVTPHNCAISDLLRSLPRYTAPAWLRSRVLSFCPDGHLVSRKGVERSSGVRRNGVENGPFQLIEELKGDPS